MHFIYCCHSQKVCGDNMIIVFICLCPVSQLQLPTQPEPATLTPPSTPRKRRYSVQSALCERPISPLKRGRLSSADNVFLFSTDETEEFAYRECERPLTSSVIWQVSAHVHNNWKSLGRILDLPEAELVCLEHAYQDLRECCFQTMLKWKDMNPGLCTYGILYTALCEIGLKSVALKFCAF